MAENKELLDLLEKIKIIHQQKANDYASPTDRYENFSRSAEISSWFSLPVDKVFATLIGVKLARLATLLGRTILPANESIEDSFLDLTTYCALWSSYNKRLANQDKKVASGSILEISDEELRMQQAMQNSIPSWKR